VRDGHCRKDICGFRLLLSVIAWCMELVLGISAPWVKNGKEYVNVSYVADGRRIAIK
jgi:hypothetical protein